MGHVHVPRWRRTGEARLHPVQDDDPRGRPPGHAGHLPDEDVSGLPWEKEETDEGKGEEAKVKVGKVVMAWLVADDDDDDDDGRGRREDEDDEDEHKVDDEDDEDEHEEDEEEDVDEDEVDGEDEDAMAWQAGGARADDDDDGRGGRREDEDDEDEHKGRAQSG